MLAHRLRRWPNVKTTLYQLLVFAGKTAAAEISGKRKNNLAGIYDDFNFVCDNMYIFM